MSNSTFKLYAIVVAPSSPGHSLPRESRPRQWRSACGIKNPWISTRRNSSNNDATQPTICEPFPAALDAASPTNGSSFQHFVPTSEHESMQTFDGRDDRPRMFNAICCCAHCKPLLQNSTTNTNQSRILLNIRRVYRMRRRRRRRQFI